MSSAPDSANILLWSKISPTSQRVGFTFIFECLIILWQLWLRRSVFGLHSVLGIAQWETAHRERWALSNNKKEQFNAPADLIKWFFPLYQLPAHKLLYLANTDRGRQQQQHESESIFISGFLFVIIYLCSPSYPRRLFICLRKTTHTRTRSAFI